MSSFESAMDEAFSILEMIKSGNEVYDEFYESSRESYVSFVNYAPSVKI